MTSFVGDAISNEGCLDVAATLNVVCKVQETMRTRGLREFDSDSTLDEEPGEHAREDPANRLYNAARHGGHIVETIQ